MGFHQVLNRLFEQDRNFVGLEAEDSVGFRHRYESFRTDDARRDFKSKVRRLLLRAYEVVITDPSALVAIRQRAIVEMKRISDKGRDETRGPLPFRLR